MAEGRRGWPDAVAVSALAADQARPILLVEHDRPPTATRQALEGRPEAIVVGGTAAVSDAVEASIDDVVGDVRRLAGADRYAGTAFPDANGSLAGDAAARVGHDRRRCRRRGTCRRGGVPPASRAGRAVLVITAVG